MPVFLGEDNSVKLGDFGLSKMIQSHDFASTYVGTPFYMSPEICAAERYTLKSDIWSLGCIIYELCAREPPFNAKSHFQLVQKIKEGKIAPLPRVYSGELFSVIRDCLKVNPDMRPDTATLLNLPVVRLMRKEKEAVELSKMLHKKNELLNKKIRDFEDRLETERGYLRTDIEASLRREWEVKARLEIDRLVNEEIEQLQRRFEAEVQARVQEDLQKKAVTFGPIETQEFSSSAKSDFPHSSIGGSTDYEFPSTTDITELSIDSPEPAPLKKSARTPFGRAQTMFERQAGTPMDIEMASPSPIAIASLSLSPRRNNATKAPAARPPTIFDGQHDEANLHYRDCSGNVSDSDDDEPSFVLDSPTRPPKQLQQQPRSRNPFGPQRPILPATKTAPINRLRTQNSMATNNGGNNNGNNGKPASALVPDPQLRPQPSNGALRERCNSPNRRLSKIPSVTNLNGNTGSNGNGENGFQRKPSSGSSSAKKESSEQQPLGQPPTLPKVATKNNNVKGRTLIELQQARAGGRPVESNNNSSNTSPKRPTSFKDRINAATGNTTTATSSSSNAAPTNVTPTTSNRNSFTEPVAVWDPEKDEMPSPFLVRHKRMARV